MQFYNFFSWDKPSYNQRLLFIALLLIFFFAPLFRAANRPFPLMITELAALWLLFYCVIQRPGFRSLRMDLRILLGAVLGFPLLYLMPLPFDWWAALPGRDIYGTTLKLIDSQSYMSVSVMSVKTEQAWLALLPPVAIFTVVSLLEVGRVKALVAAFLVIAFGEACLGLIQYGDGPLSILRLGNPYNDSSAVGTYINRNHLAGLLEMALPVALGMLAATIGRSRSQLSYARNFKEKALGFIDNFSQNAVVHAFTCVVILLGLVFTQSRSGVGLAMITILLAMIAYARRLGGTNVFGLFGTLFAVVLGAGVLTGLAPVLSRFTVDPLADNRWEIFSFSLRGIGEFFPVGSGPGTFPYVFPRFQMNIDGFVNHAHNDYLEWLFEGGLLAALLMFAIIVVFLRQWPRLWITERWSEFRFMKIGAGIGVFAMMLHGMTDFNLHIPANALFFAFLMAVFFHSGDEASNVDRATRNHRDAGMSRIPVPILPKPDAATAPKNPFLEE